MARIEVDSSLFYHKKMEAFMKGASIGRVEAVGHLVFLWSWCEDHAPEGVLPKMNDSEIAANCKYFGEANKFVTALLDAGFLDRASGGLTVHDRAEWLTDISRRKLKRRTNDRSNVRSNDRKKVGQMSGQMTDANAVSTESLSLPVSKPREDLETTTETKKPKELPVHVQFVDRFKSVYEQQVGKVFKYGNAQFILASRLIKNHGLEETVARAKVLAKMCRDRSMWFTKNGWADFSIEKLSSQWNAIIGEAIPDDGQELERSVQKVREQRERSNKALGL